MSGTGCFRRLFVFSVCRLVSRRCHPIASITSGPFTCSTIKTLTAAPLHPRRSSPCLSRTNFRPFRPQPLDAPTHRFVSHFQRVRCVSGFVLSAQTCRHIPPNRVRYPTDQSFISGCSPPRLTATQLPLITELWLPPTRTSTVLFMRLRRRTRKALRFSALPCWGERSEPRASLPLNRGYNP